MYQAPKVPGTKDDIGRSLAQMVIERDNHPFRGGLLDTEHLDTLGQVELVIVVVGAEKSGLGAGVCE